MSKRAQLKEHIHTLEEIGNIMTALKNLSLMEINKAGRFISAQERVNETIKAAGRDFLYHYPDFLTYMHMGKPSLYILIGSERGLCGEFNELVLDGLKAVEYTDTAVIPEFIVIGRKLAAKLADDKRVIQVIDGPDTTEEIPDIILNVINAIRAIQSESEFKPGHWAILFCEENQNAITAKTLHPFVEFRNEQAPAFTIPPVLNVTAETFLSDFIAQYLFSALYLTFYASFTAENRLRSRHLENALERLDNKITYLTHNINLLRQEEITQEIQVIMLSAEAILEEMQIEGGNNDDYQ